MLRCVFIVFVFSGVGGLFVLVVVCCLLWAFAGWGLGLGLVCGFGFVTDWGWVCWCCVCLFCCVCFGLVVLFIGLVVLLGVCLCGGWVCCMVGDVCLSDVRMSIYYKVVWFWCVGFVWVG